jgi:hypothetical protein
MSLLLLLWPYTANVPAQIVDYGVKPAFQIIYNQTSNILVDKTKAIVQKTTTQYSSPSVQYSSPTQVYGGVDIHNARQPDIQYVYSPKSSVTIDRTRAQFQATSTTYSSSATQYSSPSQVYGGGDPKTAIGPSITAINNFKPSMERTTG